MGFGEVVEDGRGRAERGHRRKDEVGLCGMEVAAAGIDA